MLKVLFQTRIEDLPEAPPLATGLRFICRLFSSPQRHHSWVPAYRRPRLRRYSLGATTGDAGPRGHRAIIAILFSFERSLPP